MSPAHQFEFLVALLIAIAALEVAARRFRLPPAAAFILGGLGLALTPGVPAFTLDAELVLLIFLPPLLMSAGYFTAWAEFRENLVAIGLLAIGAVIFTTMAVGVVAHVLVPGLPWPVCFALGAVVSPPDAVAATAVLKPLSLPGRLTATIEGESLLNDASSLVLFRLAVAASLTGTFSAVDAGRSFAVVAVGGVALGWAVGRAGLALLPRLRDSQLAILVTLLLPTVAYIGGERLHVSGVLAVVTAGIMVGRHQHAVVSAVTRIRAQAFWGVLTFLLESLLFVLIGLALRDVLERLADVPDAGRAVWLPVAGVVAATVLARLVWVYGTWAGRHAARALRLPGVGAPSLATATIVGWAGMRGVVTLAAALSLPATVPGRDFVLVSAFAVILVTVLVQGTTLGPLIRLLRMSGSEDEQHRQRSEARARSRVADAQLQAISTLSKQHDGSERHPRLLEQFSRQAKLAMASLDDAEAHSVHRAEHHSAVLEAVNAGRAARLSGTVLDVVLIRQGAFLGRQRARFGVVAWRGGRGCGGA